MEKEMRKQWEKRKGVGKREMRNRKSKKGENEMMGKIRRGNET